MSQNNNLLENIEQNEKNLLSVLDQMDNLLNLYEKTYDLKDLKQEDDINDQQIQQDEHFDRLQFNDEDDRLTDIETKLLEQMNLIFKDIQKIHISVNDTIKKLPNEDDQNIKENQAFDNYVHGLEIENLEQIVKQLQLPDDQNNLEDFQIPKIQFINKKSEEE